MVSQVYLKTRLNSENGGKRAEKMHRSDHQSARAERSLADDKLNKQACKLRVLNYFAEDFTVLGGPLRLSLSHLYAQMCLQNV